MYFPYAVLRPYSSNGTNAARIEKYTGDGQEVGDKDACKPHNERGKKANNCLDRVWNVAHSNLGKVPTNFGVGEMEQDEGNIATKTRDMVH